MGILTYDYLARCDYVCFGAHTARVALQLVLRTQDVAESVRKAAFRTLGDDVRKPLLRYSVTCSVVLLILHYVLTLSSKPLELFL